MSAWVESTLNETHAGKVPQWPTQLRASGREQFRNLGFPTTALEAWKYTPVRAIAEGNFQAVDTISKVDSFSSHCHAGNDAWRLTFVNGRFAPDLSARNGLPSGLILGSLSEAIASQSDMVESHFGKIVEHPKAAFAALNLAAFSDGAFIRVPRGVILEKPIEILHLTISEGSAIVAQPRHLVIAEAASQAVLLETYSGGGASPSLTNAVTEIVTEANAVLDHYKLQIESSHNYHVGTSAILQKACSVYRNLQLSIGSKLSRSEVTTVLSESGAECSLDGLYVAGGQQHVDHQTLIDHATPHCTSSELYKGILDGSAKGVFNGTILVRKDAQKTNSRQSNKNLILSDDAIVNTKPLLEIYANDVKCSHGATIGRLDENQVFYLRSRGIDQALARNLLTYAFAGEVVQNIRLGSLKQKLEDHFMNRLNIGMVRAEELQ